ncbi:PREDICTED: solute carrier family 2, facilitated glucose transporter member 5-like [Dipodomys ordii]|uniref:Solute carrier family 2, facilitated glucose transporter member 5 n=1 Tax=Dipodomys ordii TaxID=10020 RepID=A0A1S3GED7_DIPOR|nr:PREDICTED: solute carrier family 2, facilitated glucose transporter member 5-like [Dipodomys ordii]
MEQPELRKGRLTLVLAIATLISAFGSSFQYGYNVAAVNSPSEIMKQFYNDTYNEKTGELIDEFPLTLLWSLTVSMFPFGGFIGAILAGPLVNQFGRKGGLLLNNIFSVVPAILMGCSKVAKLYELIIFSRLLVGICAGVSSNVVPMYLGELAPKNLRGALGVVPQLFITVGILVAQLFGLRNVLANETGWPFLLALTGIPAVLQLLILPFFPESPRYLLIQKKDPEAARKGPHPQDQVSWVPYISITCVIAYVIGHALGPSPIPALFITEIFLQSSRPAAFMVGGSIHWLSNFAVGLIFPFIQMGLGPYSFIIFAVICLLTTIYISMAVPETKAQTFIEINKIFAKMNKVLEVHPERQPPDLPLANSRGSEAWGPRYLDLRNETRLARM